MSSTAPVQSDDEILLTPDELVKRWKKRITVKTLSNWRAKDGAGPRFIKLGGATLYPLSAVKDFEKGRTVSSVAENKKLGKGKP